MGITWMTKFRIVADGVEIIMLEPTDSDIGCSFSNFKKMRRAANS